MNHYAATGFWRCYDALPAAIRQLADKQFELLKANPRHPSLHYKIVGRFRSARVGQQYRALGVDVDDGVPMKAAPRHVGSSFSAPAV